MRHVIAGLALLIAAASYGFLMLPAAWVQTTSTASVAAPVPPVNVLTPVMSQAPPPPNPFPGVKPIHPEWLYRLRYSDKPLRKYGLIAEDPAALGLTVVFYGNADQCHNAALERGFVWVSNPAIYSPSILGGHWKHPSGACLYGS